MTWESDLQKMHDEEGEEFDKFISNLHGSLWKSYDNDVFIVLGKSGSSIDIWRILSAREGVAKITFGFLMNQKRIE